MLSCEMGESGTKAALIESIRCCRNGLGKLRTVAWPAAVELAVVEWAAIAPVRSAQLGCGKHATSAAHAAVTASRTPIRRLACALALRCRPRCRPRYRVGLACRPPLVRPPLTCTSCTSCATSDPPGTVLPAV
jgi:hypothetical protein